MKGNQFPMQGRRTLLIDPTREDPWKSLDFDPVTGNICARFDAVTQSWSNKGEKTVEVLQLDKREALAAGYLKTWRRLSEAVQEALGQIEPNPEVLITKLQAADDHHLLSWCFGDRGSACEPLSTLRRQHPALWARCVQALKS
ncbi:MAG: hypothetical protein INR62_09000 [Rhodospirillales bacterium]|nr:hypothetical protein [Acetobacter sp.]